MMRSVAALYVEPDGPYAGLDGVEVWDEARDARAYTGPHPVVAHPPCTRWCKPATIHFQRDGNDGGCFAAALESVRDFGGILEHPAYSLAWRWFGLCTPPLSGGWVNADWIGGWTCHVNQGHYGHRAKKPTWLYAHSSKIPSLKWGQSKSAMNHEGLGSGKVRSVTPVPFRDLLLSMARSVKGQ